jgi:hypothetical protein
MPFFRAVPKRKVECKTTPLWQPTDGLFWCANQGFSTWFQSKIPRINCDARDQIFLVFPHRPAMLIHEIVLQLREFDSLISPQNFKGGSYKGITHGLHP